jgi:hypothetical protein
VPARELAECPLVAARNPGHERFVAVIHRACAVGIAIVDPLQLVAFSINASEWRILCREESRDAPDRLSAAGTNVLNNRGFATEAPTGRPVSDVNPRIIPARRRRIRGRCAPPRAPAARLAIDELAEAVVEAASHGSRCRRR